MISIAVIDISADSRNRIIEQLHSFLRIDAQGFSILPQVSIRPFSLNELKFHDVPDICIVGDEVISRHIMEVSRIRTLFQESVIIAFVHNPEQNISLVDHLARLGADDVLSDTEEPSIILRKLIFVSRRKREKKKNGRLIVVDSGKGGLGVTSLVAGLGEALVLQGNATLLVDLDFETQDLSRFLQVRPYVNENLRLILDGQRPLQEEFVRDCLMQVIEDEPSWRCMPPPPGDDLAEKLCSQTRSYVSILEFLGHTYEYILVDIGCAGGAFRKSMHRFADLALFVVNNDPAAFYASIHRVSEVRSALSAKAKLILVENSTQPKGLSSHMLREEFSRSAGLENKDWLSVTLPFCSQGSRWPGSGGTLYSEGKQSLKRGFKALLEESSLAEKDYRVEGWFSNARKYFNTAKEVFLPIKAKSAIINNSCEDVLQIPSDDTLKSLPLSHEEWVSPVTIEWELESKKEEEFVSTAQVA